MPQFSLSLRTRAILEGVIENRREYGRFRQRSLEIQVEGLGAKTTRIEVKLFGIPSKGDRAIVCFGGAMRAEDGWYQSDEGLLEEDIVEALAGFLRSCTGSQQKRAQLVFSRRSSIGKRARHLAACQIRLDFLKSKGWGENYEAGRLQEKIAEHIEGIGRILAFSIHKTSHYAATGVRFNELHAGEVVLRFPLREDLSESSAVIEASLPQAARGHGAQIVASFCRWAREAAG